MNDDRPITRAEYDNFTKFVYEMFDAFITRIKALEGGGSS